MADILSYCMFHQQHMISGNYSSVEGDKILLCLCGLGFLGYNRIHKCIYLFKYRTSARSLCKQKEMRVQLFVPRGHNSHILKRLGCNKICHGISPNYQRDEGSRNTLVRTSTHLSQQAHFSKRAAQ